MSSRHAVTDAAIHPLLSERFSPRAFDTERMLSEATMNSLIEAARWAPSAFNLQPWRFIVAHRGSETFDRIVATLVGFNQAWAPNAAALIVNIAEVASPEGREQIWAEYDLGQAVAHLSVQAQHEGLSVHQMGGFDVAQISEAFGLAENLKPMSVSAIGYLGDVDTLPAEIQEAEAQPRMRNAAETLIIAS